MDSQQHGFKVGDQVRATRRRDFPHGKVMQLLDDGFVLVRWNGQLLETAHHSDLEALPANI
ncbi:MAG: hypothetical protein H7Y02_07680 [Candidatus Obscuribacterales bacterium]|nr:hypothetical protein [Steroidobacteraceae bacterium]